MGRELLSLAGLCLLALCLSSVHFFYSCILLAFRKAEVRFVVTALLFRPRIVCFS